MIGLPAQAQQPTPDAAWRVSALRLCFYLHFPEGDQVKDEIAAVMNVAVDLGAFILECDEDDERRRRLYIAEMVRDRWPETPPGEFMRLVRMMVCGVVDDIPIPAGGFAAGDLGGDGAGGGGAG